MIKGIKGALTICAMAIAGMGVTSTVHAQDSDLQVGPFNGVTFTPSWSGNVLTIEIDAAGRSGNWANADTIGALHIKSIGSWDSVSLSGPGAAGSWTILNKELNANGCVGGGSGSGNQDACSFGTPIALSDNMIFQFTFTGGTQDFTMPHIKVQMFGDGGTKKIGSLMSKDFMSIPAIPEPSTYAMLLGGLGILAVARRNAKKKAA